MKKTSAMLAVLALALAPSLAAAMCSEPGHVRSSSQCPQGQVWDGTLKACVPAAQS